VQSFRPAVAARLAELAPLLLDQLDAVTERMVAVLLRTEPAYRELAAGPDEDLQASVRAGMEQGMRALVGTGAPGSGRVPAREVGRRRAAQGIPLEAVLRAYRLGGQVTWEALLAAARLANGGDDPLLLEVAGSVWRANDRDCGEVAEGYREEQRRRALADEEARRRALDALLDGRGGDGVLRAHAELLGLPPRGRLLVVVALPGAGGRPALPEPEVALQGPGMRAVWGTRSVAQVGLVSLGVRRLADVVARLDGLTAGPVGVSAVVDGVPEVAEAFRLAESAARSLPPAVPRVATIDERLPEALLSNSPEIHSRLVGQSFGGLLELPREERAVLMETLAAFLAADGSPTRAADALYCHRNTVMHRLRRIESVTGRKVTDPRSRLLWQLALLTHSA
jgi:hypothetical protein